MQHNNFLILCFACTSAKKRKCTNYTKTQSGWYFNNYSFSNRRE